MKLYTEEQVNTMLRRARLHNQDDTEVFTNEYLIADETSIELPTDEEIQAQVGLMGTLGDIGFIEGAKWVIEQIKQQEK